MVLTRVEHELPGFGDGQQALVDARPANLTVIDVPAVQHGFDVGPATEHGRAAVVQALDEVVRPLVGSSPALVTTPASTAAGTSR